MEEHFDDLQQILGYQGAIDEREGLSTLGDEIYIVPFWTPEFCQPIIRAADPHRL